MLLNSNITKEIILQKANLCGREDRGARKEDIFAKMGVGSNPVISIFSTLKIFFRPFKRLSINTIIKTIAKLG